MKRSKANSARYYFNDGQGWGLLESRTEPDAVQEILRDFPTMYDEDDVSGGRLDISVGVERGRRGSGISRVDIVTIEIEEGER